MPYSTVPDKSVGDFFTEGMWDTAIKDNLNKGLLRPIADSFPSAAASVVFSLIPADWAHLMLIWYLRGTQASSTVNNHIRFNADTGANYAYVDLETTTDVGTTQTFSSFAATLLTCGSSPANSAIANMYSSGVIFIPNYKQTTSYKTIIGINASKVATTAGGLHLFEFMGLWRSTAAITSVTILPASGNIVAGSRVTLYGLGHF